MERLIDFSWAHSERGAKLRIKPGEPEFSLIEGTHIELHLFS